MSLNDLIGASGVFILLVTYFLNLSGKLPSDNPWYPALNALGAGIAGFASYLIHYWPFVILEASWMMISLLGLFKIMTKKNELRN